MGMFSKLSTAQVFNKSQFFQEGRYIVKIQNVKFVNGHNGESFVIEARTIAAISDVINAPKPNEMAVHIWNISGSELKKTMGKNTWMGFMCAVLDLDPCDQDDDDWEKISNEVIDDNAFEGIEMLLECHNTTTKSGGPFTVHNWIGKATDETREEFGL